MNKSRCKKCPTMLIWIKNEHAKNEPFDLQPTRVLVVLGDKSPRGKEYDLGGMPYKIETARLNHFLTCKAAHAFRKTKKDGPETAPLPPPPTAPKENPAIGAELTECEMCQAVFKSTGRTVCPICLGEDQEGG